MFACVSDGLLFGVGFGHLLSVLAPGAALTLFDRCLTVRLVQRFRIYVGAAQLVSDIESQTRLLPRVGWVPQALQSVCLPVQNNNTQYPVSATDKYPTTARALRTRVKLLESKEGGQHHGNAP